MNRRETLLGAAALAACGPAGSQAPAAPFPIRRGVNLGNALEAPNEGDWGYRIDAVHLRAIKDAGFDGVRVPVRWDAHVIDGDAIDPIFFARVDQVIDQALAADLRVQLDLHHYDALVQGGLRQPHETRFLRIWRQIALRYRDVPDTLLFEPFNEPNGRHWDGQALIDLQRRVADVIRSNGPERLIVFGPGNWQNIDALERWRPPAGENIAVSVHYYEPHAFTHQKAEWLGDEAPTFDRDWGTVADRSQVAEHVGAAARWARRHGLPMQLGEFGVNIAVPPRQRAAWTRAVREACDAEGLGWCVWDFAGAFPIWDRETRSFIPLMLDALFGQ